MDEICNDLRLARSSNEKLIRVCKQVAAEASALEERFGSVHGALKVSYEVSLEREKALEERSRSIEERERMVGLLLGEKEKELARLEGRIKWCGEECARKERESDRSSSELKDKEIELKSLRMSCEEVFEEYGRKRVEVEELQRLAAEAVVRVQSEEERLKMVEGLVERMHEEMEWVSRELAAKQEQLGSVERLLVLQSRELEVKSQRTGYVRSTLGQAEVELVMKNEQLSMARSSLDDKMRELRLENEKINALAILREQASKDWEVKKEELSSVEKLIFDKTTLLGKKHEELGSVESLLQQNREELDMGRKELASTRESAVKCHRDLELKKEDMEMIETTLIEWSEVADSKMEKLVSLENSIDKRADELNLIRDELESRKEELNRMEKLISEQGQEKTGKEEDLQSLLDSIARSCDDILLKKEEFDGLQKSIDEFSGELKAKERRLENCTIELKIKEKEIERNCIRTRQCEDEFRMMEMQCTSVKELVVGCTKELEAKREQLELVKTSFCNLSEQVEFERNKLKRLQKESSEYRMGLEVKEQQLQLFHLTLDKCYEEFCSKKSSLEGRCRGEDKSQPGFETDNPQWENAIVPSDAPSRSTTFNKSKMFRKEFWETYVGGIDPVKEVLDSIKGPYEQFIREERLGFDDEDLRFHILLLDRLIEASFPVTPDIKALALTLATDWKTKLRAEKEWPLEVSVFLHLVAAFKLISFFDQDEIAELAESLPVRRTCSKLYRILGIAEKRPGAPGSPTLSMRRLHKEKKRSRTAVEVPPKKLPRGLI